jgi:3-oxoacyl-[acyl-carrier-protein] synthase II
MPTAIQQSPAPPAIRAVVTGVGPLSAIGAGREAFFDALMAGQHGFGPITLCPTDDSPSKIAAEVKDFDLGRFVENGAVFARHTPRPVQFALAAAVLALHDSELDLDQCDPDRFGVHVGTSIGNVATMFSLRDRYQTAGDVPPHAAFHAFSHSAACVVSSFFNIRGPVHTTTSGCNSGLDALGQSMRSIEAGATDAMLVIGSDCEVLPEVLAVLNASNSLSTRYNATPGRASRPFDRGRDGNVLGEGAGALLLESESHARARGARIYARLDGYQVCAAGQNRQYSHDHPTPDLRPYVRALSGAITEAGWQPEEVDLVSANGSSSVIYDRIEALALGELFGAAVGKIPVTSIKSMLGQHGAGTSALQAIAACLSIRRGRVPPTINHEEVDPDCRALRIVTEAASFRPRRVLLHAIGLGGFYSSAAALAAVNEVESERTGIHTVQWSEGGHPRFTPAAEFQRPLTPWRPRSD